MNRRKFLQVSAVGAAGLLAATPAEALLSSTKSHAEKAQPYGAYRLLALGEVRPAGWLERQLRLQADGLGGHLDEFWPDVGPSSGWLGGTGESWERGPYFLDGLVPLAYLLDDDVLKAKAQKFIEWTLQHQQPDGMIGPPGNDDWWPRMVMTKVLAQYYEATSDPRVLPMLTRYFHHQLEAMPGRPLQSWGQYRWQDEAYVVEWLYERTDDPALPQLVKLLQQQGYDWEAQFRKFKYTGPTPREYISHGLSPEAMQTHGVNNAQGLKTAAVQYRHSGNPGERAAFFRQMDALDKYHGMPNGMFSCDEHLGGLNPSHGSELCSVVETMFSLEVSLAAFGDASIADRLEKIAFNALPGTFTDDMWAHQYDQQSNQIQVGLLTKPWTTNGPESNLYGLEPHFGCCTANFHQGWPKFAASLWMRSAEDGLVAAVYSPCSLRTSVRGTPVHIEEETEYPFLGKVRFTLQPERPLHFPLSLRAPAWGGGTVFYINGKPVDQAVQPGTFLRLERQWNPGDVIEVVMPMQPRVTRWYQHSVALERGPLVFSFDPGENWVKLRDRGMTADWQVYPTKQWNYALNVSESSVSNVKVEARPPGGRPFAVTEPSVSLRVPARRLDTWRSEDGVASAPPLSPVTSSAAEEEVTLIPYASAKLRVTAFPSLTV